jgi:hypothetical protein
MNNTTPPSKTETTSIQNSDNPSLVLRLLKGQRWGWPISSLSEWYYEPSAFVPDEESALKQVEVITITIGLRQVKIEGANLEKICDVLEQGGGAMLIEQGRRFRALAKPGDIYVDRIEVTDSDGENPATAGNNDTETEELPSVDDE